MILDTHTWLWYYLGDPQLSDRARQLIETPGQVSFISPASYWELAIKVGSGKYLLNESFDDLLRHSIFDNGFQILPIEPHHVAQLAVLPCPTKHKDPFDRLLVSQALAEHCPILSADRDLDGYGVSRLW